MGQEVTIYVRLLDEDVHVWRPVMARSNGNGRYTILAQDCDLSDEHWEFLPGQTVIVRAKKLSGGPCLCAFRLG